MKAIKCAMRPAALLLAASLTAAPLPQAAAADGMAKSLQLPSLREIYGEYFLLGNIFSGFRDFSESNLADSRFDLLKRHFNVLTAENAMKPVYISPSKGSYSFGGADRMIRAAGEAGLPVHGHALTWHSQSAEWLTQGCNRAEAKANLEAFIAQVAGHFAGKLLSWDVVNEAFHESPGSSVWRDALRKNSPWYIAYENGADKSKGESGADYIYDAFVSARLADPGATLYYNDYNETERAKREAIAAMAEEYNAAWKKDPRNAEPDRLLIEGLGMQAHYWTDDLNIRAVEDTIKRFAATGAVISVSELDIPAGNWREYKTLTESEEKKQARFYAQLFQVYKEYGDAIERVTFWGLEDPASWRRQGSPLLFDGHFNAKPAYYAVADPDGYLAGQYDDPKTRDAALTEALKPDAAAPAETPNLSTASGWARDNISKAYGIGIIPASLQDQYTRNCTRAEFCALAAELIETLTGKPITERKVFADDRGDGHIQKIGGLGIVNGTDTAGNLFSPDRGIQRQEAAVILARVADSGLNKPLPDGEIAFADLDGSFAVDFIKKMRGGGIMSGKSADTFDPAGPFTREESIITILKLWEYYFS